jgi:hypothetical protein
MSPTIILVIISILLVVLMIPVKSARRWHVEPVSEVVSGTESEGFLTPEIENPPPHLLLGSQSEAEQAHRTDVYSRLATVRIDPYE